MAHKARVLPGEKTIRMHFAVSFFIHWFIVRCQILIWVFCR
jgi:hypothetical protein